MAIKPKVPVGKRLLVQAFGQPLESLLPVFGPVVAVLLVMHDIETGKPVACGYIFIDCLGSIFFERLVNFRNCVAEAVEIDIFSHDMLL